MRRRVAVRSYCCFCSCTCWERGVALRSCSRGRRRIADDLRRTVAWCCKFASRRHSARDRSRRSRSMQCCCWPRSSGRWDKGGNPRRWQPTVATVAIHCKTGSPFDLTLAFQSCEGACWQHALEVRADTGTHPRVDFDFDEDYFAGTCQTLCFLCADRTCLF